MSEVLDSETFSLVYKHSWSRPFYKLSRCVHVRSYGEGISQATNTRAQLHKMWVWQVLSPFFSLLLWPVLVQQHKGPLKLRGSFTLDVDKASFGPPFFWSVFTYEHKGPLEFRVPFTLAVDQASVGSHSCCHFGLCLHKGLLLITTTNDLRSS